VDGERDKKRHQDERRAIILSTWNWPLRRNGAKIRGKKSHLTRTETCPGAVPRRPGHECDHLTCRPFTGRRLIGSAAGGARGRRSETPSDPRAQPDGASPRDSAERISSVLSVINPYLGAIRHYAVVRTAQSLFPSGEKSKQADGNILGVCPPRQTAAANVRIQPDPGVRVLRTCGA
jgi:hypothetical protein